MSLEPNNNNNLKQNSAKTLCTKGLVPLATSATLRMEKMNSNAKLVYLIVIKRSHVRLFLIMDFVFMVLLLFFYCN